MKPKYMIITFLIILSCNKSTQSEKSLELVIKTKNIKERGILKNDQIFEIDAEIPFTETIDLGIEKLIEIWKNEIEKIDHYKHYKDYYKNNKDEFSYYSDYKIFKNEKINITSILYEEYKIQKSAANGIKRYYPINLKENKKIEISEIMSKDQLESLINVLKEQVKDRYKTFHKNFILTPDEFEKEFEEVFLKYKYYFNNNQIIIFYDPLIIDCHACGKIEFIFPINENTELNNKT